MSFGKVARKLKRVGKTAVQFRFTSTFEYIELNCNGTWRPDNLRVIWLRSHRRVQSIDVQWVPTEDRGPNGAEGKAAFNPPLSVALIVTLYRDSNVAGFQSKEYKYYIENDGPGGKKILASFNCDMAEYVGIPTSKNTLDMTFKSVSRKIDKAVLGITLESEFIKQGTSLDDDMQSTFSSMSAGRDSLAFDDEDDDEEVGAHAAARPPPSPQLNKVAEETESEESQSENSLIILGTGQTLKRQTIPRVAPNKPPRTQSIYRPAKNSKIQIPEIQITRSNGTVVEPLVSTETPDETQAVLKSDSDQIQSGAKVAKLGQTPPTSRAESNLSQVAMNSKSENWTPPIAQSNRDQSAESDRAPPSSKAKVDQPQPAVKSESSDTPTVPIIESNQDQSASKPSPASKIESNQDQSASKASPASKIESNQGQSNSKPSPAPIVESNQDQSASKPSPAPIVESNQDQSASKPSPASKIESNQDQSASKPSPASIVKSNQDQSASKASPASKIESNQDQSNSKPSPAPIVESNQDQSASKPSPTPIVESNQDQSASKPSPASKIESNQDQSASKPSPASIVKSNQDKSASKVSPASKIESNQDQSASKPSPASIVKSNQDQSASKASPASKIESNQDQSNSKPSPAPIVESNQDQSASKPSPAPIVESNQDQSASKPSPASKIESNQDQSASKPSPASIVKSNQDKSASKVSPASKIESNQDQSNSKPSPVSIVESNQDQSASKPSPAPIVESNQDQSASKPSPASKIESNQDQSASKPSPASIVKSNQDKSASKVSPASKIESNQDQSNSKPSPVSIVESNQDQSASKPSPAPIVESNQDQSASKPSPASKIESNQDQSASKPSPASIVKSNQDQSASKPSPASKMESNQDQSNSKPSPALKLEAQVHVPVKSKSVATQITPIVESNAATQTALESSQTPPTLKDNSVQAQVAVKSISVLTTEPSQSGQTGSAPLTQGQGTLKSIQNQAQTTISKTKSSQPALTSKPSHSPTVPKPKSDLPQTQTAPKSEITPAQRQVSLKSETNQSQARTRKSESNQAQTQTQKSESNQAQTQIQKSESNHSKSLPKSATDKNKAERNVTGTSLVPSALRTGKLEEHTAPLEQQQPSESTAGTETWVKREFSPSPADQPLATPETTPQPGMGPAQVLDADISKPADPGPSNGVLQELEPSDAAQLQAQNTEHTAVSVNGTNEEASSAGAGAKYLSSSIQLIQKGTVNVFVGKFEKNQGEAPSSPSSFAKRHQETPSKEELNGPAKQEQPSIEEVEEPPEREQPPVEKVDEPPEPEQPVKEEQVEAVGDESPDPSMSLTKKAENFMAGVQRKERLDSPSPELPEMQSSEPTLEKESEKLTPPKPPRTNSRRKNRGGEIVEVEQNGDSREYETEEQSSPPGNTFDAFDFVFETSKLIVAQMKQGQSQQQPTATGTSESPSSRNRITVQSKEEYVPPPNPYLEDGGAGEEAPEEISPTASWLGDASFIDCFGEPVWRQKLDNAEIIGLYFSANWCPPCRRFLPKLVKFYHHLKQHNKSFEILYISSDYSKQEMLRYMEEQQMPWVGLAFNSSIADKLRADFSVSAIPLFTVVSTSGIKLEESAKKSVEASTSSSGVLKLYNKWYERLQGGGVDSSVEEKQKKGLFQKVKDAVKSPGKDDSMDLDNSASQSPTPDSKDYQAGATQGSRQTVEDRPRQKSKSKSHPATSDLLEEKEDRIRYLEEVNMSLKQTNDDLNEEVAELRRTLAEAQQKLGALEESSRQLEDEKRELIANLNIRGWLFKRGLKGPTANVWRRRFFRCDQGSKIYYYKSATEGQPQGFIDLDKVISCQEVSAAQQDKNHATFLVQCDGRTYQLQAHDEATMRKWMGAIEYLRAWRKRHGTISAGTL